MNFKFKLNLFLWSVIVVQVVAKTLIINTRSDYEETMHQDIFNSSENVVVIPIKLHIDQSFATRLTKAWGNNFQIAAKEGCMVLFKNVEDKLNELTTDITIKFLVLGIKYMKQKKKNESANASEYLKNYCTWQKHKKNNEGRWFFSILMTGQDLYYLDTDGLVRTQCTGRTYRNGLCTIDKSCAVIEGDIDSITLAFLHEFAHSLGIGHDPLKGLCRNDFIMSPHFHRLRKPTSWSRCSIKQFSEFRKTEKGKCLLLDGNRQTQLRKEYYAPIIRQKDGNNRVQYKIVRAKVNNPGGPQKVYIF